MSASEILMLLTLVVNAGSFLLSAIAIVISINNNKKK